MNAEMVVTFTSVIPAMERKLNTLLEQLVVKTAGEIKTRAQDMAPLDTGALKDSIHVVTHRGPAEYSQAMSKAKTRRPGVKIHKKVKPDGPYEAIVAVGVEYGFYVEYGHAAARKTTRMSTRKSGLTAQRISDRKFVTAVGAHPFLRPAVHERTQPFIDAVGEVIRLAATP